MIFRLIEKSGELKGKMSYLAQNEHDNFSIETSLNEIIATSLIEGVELKRESVRSSLHKKLNIALNREDKSVLYPVKQGVFRDHNEMQIVSGFIGKEKIHYIAIPHKQINTSIQALIEYINSSSNNFIVKSAVAHLWFESIHPYDDGNGRIGRAIVNYILAKDGGLDNRYYSISSAINQDRKGYYDTLEQSQNLLYNPNLDITKWIVWHTKSIEKSIDISLYNIEEVVKKTRFHDKIKHIKLNEKQNKVINKLLDSREGNFEGGLTNKKYRGLTKTDAVTASRHLKEIIKEIEGYGGRNTRYELNLLI